MNEYEESRRGFLTKLGLSVGATLVASTKLSAVVLNNKEEFFLTPEQHAFMETYEGWMDEFIPVIHAHRNNQNDLEAKKRIAELSEVAKEWQPQLIEYMKEENFARYYMTATERMTKEIY